LPDGLFRDWTSEYSGSSLKERYRIKYKLFSDTFVNTLKIDKKYPDTGVIDKFLSELTTKKYNLKLKLSEKYSLKAFSLLMLLKGRRAKSFPHILGVIEKIIKENKSKPDILDCFSLAIEKMIDKKMTNLNDNLYDLIWLIYLTKSLGLKPIKFPKKINLELIKSLKTNSFTLFKPLPPDIKLYNTIKKPGTNTLLLEHLDLFKK
jgi:hypothetical protein